MKIFFILFRYLAFTFILVSNVGAEHLLEHETTGNEWIHRPETTYEKFLPLAIEGDPEIQNFLGYMFFYGESVLQDYEEAHTWFHRAAEQGNLKAQKNLAIFHSEDAINVPQKYRNLDESSEWAARAEKNYYRLKRLKKIRIKPGINQEYQDSNALMSGKIEIGEKIYFTFCAGCHGFNGVATYPDAPSFISGERLLKDNATLMNSIINGKGGEPGWDDTIDDELLQYTLSYIRARFSDGEVEIESQSKKEIDVEDPLTSGEKLYTNFCAGCHGFNGIAHYVNSPSFALGERLYKSDNELESSITSGKNSMPSWANKLSSDQIMNIITFIRTLPSSFQQGISGKHRVNPESYFWIRPRGETGVEWLGADPIGFPHPDE